MGLHTQQQTGPDDTTLAATRLADVTSSMLKAGNVCSHLMYDAMSTTEVENELRQVALRSSSHWVEGCHGVEGVMVVGVSWCRGSHGGGSVMV